MFQVWVMVTTPNGGAAVELVRKQMSMEQASAIIRSLPKYDPMTQPLTNCRTLADALAKQWIA